MIPTPSLNLPREQLPQIRDHEHFKKWLDATGIHHNTHPDFPLERLRPTQWDFDDAKVAAIRREGSKKPIVVSDDYFVLDGHHRWKAFLSWPFGYGCVLHVDLPIAALIGVARQYVADAVPVSETINIPRMKTFLEFYGDTQKSDADRLYEAAFGDPEATPKDPLDITGRLKKVPIHTRNTTITTDIDKVKPTDPELFLAKETEETDEDYLGPTYDTRMGGGTSALNSPWAFDVESANVPSPVREWALKLETYHRFSQRYGTHGRQRLFETIAILAEKLGLAEVKTPEQVLRDFDKTRVAAGKKPIFHNRPRKPPPHVPGLFSKELNDRIAKEKEAEGHKVNEEKTFLPTRSSAEVEDVKARYKKGHLTWPEAHGELIKHGVAPSEIPKHLGEVDAKETKAAKVLKVVNGQKGKFVNNSKTTLTGKPRDEIDTEPTMVIYPVA